MRVSQNVRLSYFDEKKTLFYSIFTMRGDPYQKKGRKFFLIEIGHSIYQSIALVEFSRNMLLSNLFEVISGQKKT